MAATGIEGGTALGRIADMAADEILQSRKTTFFESSAGAGTGSFRFEGIFSGYGEDRRHDPDLFYRELRHVLRDDLEVRGLALVGLLYDIGDTLVALLWQRGDEIPSRHAPRVCDWKYEEDKISYGKEALGDLLVAFDDGIRAGSIDKVEIAEELDGLQVLL